ncbi:MAG TPA: ABC transporter substrate-binding protein [Chloroflexota bacterium]|jgi:ABC-type nitrate/sulfonate/bicarbonate transport system substrate-binding protein|nr:ABC transporter substrate-binding protein [Chloroflexota bacterium]
MVEQRRQATWRAGDAVGRRRFLALAGLAGAGWLAACGSPTSGGSQGARSASPATSATAVPAPAPMRARAGVIAGLSENIFQYLGQERGFFRDEGLDIEFVEFQAGGPMLKALLANELDIAESGFAAMPLAVANGADLKFVGATKPGLNFALYTRREINRIEELVGKSVGIADPGSFLHQLMVALFDVQGIDDRDVQYVNIGSSPAVFRAVLAGKVDAGPSTIDWVPEARRSDNTKVLLYFAEYLPKYIRTGLMVRGSDIETKRDLLVRTMVAWARSIRYSLDHKDEWLALATSRTGRPRDELEFTYDYEKEHKIVEPNLTIDPDALRFAQEMNVRAGSQSEVLPFERVATTALQQAVMQRLGEYRWNA